MSEQQRLRNILERHNGRENAITSKALAGRMGWEDSNGNPKVRFEIREIIEQSGLPVASCSEGYYVIQTRAELDEYLQDLSQRQRGIQQRKDMVREAFDGDADPQRTLNGVDA